MGTVTDAIKKWSTYKGYFRFHADLAKGVSISESFIPVTLFYHKSGRAVKMESTDDQSIMIQLLMARNLKSITVVVELQDSQLNILTQLVELSKAKIPFMVSIGIRKHMLGKKVALYVLRERTASLSMNAPPKQFRGNEYVFELDLPAAQLQQGLGEGFNLKKF